MKNGNARGFKHRAFHLKFVAVPLKMKFRVLSFLIFSFSLFLFRLCQPLCTVLR